MPTPTHSAPPAPDSFEGMIMIHQVQDRLVLNEIEGGSPQGRSCEGCDDLAVNPTGKRYTIVDSDGDQEAWCHQCIAIVLWPIRGHGGFVMGRKGF